jgi:hypothetical protein
MENLRFARDKVVALYGTSARHEAACGSLRDH